MSSSSSKSPDESNKSSENESDQIENRKRKRRIKTPLLPKNIETKINLYRQKKIIKT